MPRGKTTSGQLIESQAECRCSGGSERFFASLRMTDCRTRRGATAFATLGDLLELARYPGIFVMVSSAPCYSNEPYPFCDVQPFIERIFDVSCPKRMLWGADLSRHTCRLLPDCRQSRSNRVKQPSQHCETSFANHAGFTWFRWARGPVGGTECASSRQVPSSVLGTSRHSPLTVDHGRKIPHLIIHFGDKAILALLRVAQGDLVIRRRQIRG
jgi:hypothetical protein